MEQKKQISCTVIEPHADLLSGMGIKGKVCLLLVRTDGGNSGRSMLTGLT